MSNPSDDSSWTPQDQDPYAQGQDPAQDPYGQSAPSAQDPYGQSVPPAQDPFGQSAPSAQDPYGQPSPYGAPDGTGDGFASASPYGQASPYGEGSPYVQGSPYGAPADGQPGEGQVPPYSAPGGGQAPYGAPGAPGPYGPPGGQPGGEPPSRVLVGVLGIFLGGFGVHRFLLGYTAIGIIQIVVTILTCGFGTVWGLIEGIMVLAKSPAFERDAHGRPLKD